MKKKTFPRGVHPPEHKDLTADSKIEACPPPEKVYIPLLQHFGSPADPLVGKGDDVCLGQKIGESKALFSAAVHSSVSGKVLAIDSYDHPGGTPVLTLTVANDGLDRTLPQEADSRDPFSLSPDIIRQKVKEAGVVGLGGAAFPTTVKLSPPKDKPIDTIIINGCECEPMLTGDFRLMLECPEDIIKGAELIRLATSAKRILIAIEDNKASAVEAFQACGNHFPLALALLKTKYPQGAEKNLIYALLRRQVPQGGLPFDVGVVVQNVGTAKAVWEAVSRDKPLYERVVTVSGPGIKQPKNLLVRLGTLFEDAVQFCGGLVEDTDIVIMGGPMMGITQSSLAIPIIKGTSGILTWKTPAPSEESSCIRCGRCIGHCPMGLVPTQLMKFVKNEKLSEAEDWGILDCVECGCCHYICPSKILLVHWIRLGKNKVIRLKRKKSA